MTKEDIRAIAEEYAKYVNSAYLSDHAEKEASRVISWLSDCYHIIPKARIEQEYKNCINLYENHPKESERTIAKYVADELRAIFGLPSKTESNTSE